MTEVSPEELRRAALSALGPYADERARDALLHADIAIAPAVVTWEGSHGRVHGHHVTLAVDGACLGGLRAAPAAVDALHVALATAIASRPGEALHGLDLRWARGAVRATSEGYRDRPPEVETLHDALVAYLAAAGEGDLSRLVAEGSITGEEDDVHVSVDPRGHPHATRGITRAVRDLVGPGSRVSVGG